MLGYQGKDNPRPLPTTNMDDAAFCRGCLSRHANPDDLVPYTEKTRRQFVYSTGLQVKKTDAFTFQLCKECYTSMKMGCKFKKQCRSSDKQFKKYICLKECGATEDDFTAFLAKEDDDEFRFPYINGGITPSYQRPNEEDNESTNTSIRNFMTTLVQAEDLPETEARIVNEVIVEDADILDDSLDSLWLQDEPLMDADLNMDISLSAFSTPRIFNEDRCLAQQMVDEPMTTETDAIKPNFGTRYKPKVYADFIVAPDLDADKNNPKSSTTSSIPPRQTLKSMPDIESIFQENVPAASRLGVVALERMQDIPTIVQENVPAASRLGVVALERMQDIPTTVQENVPAASRLGVVALERMQDIPTIVQENVPAASRLGVVALERMQDIPTIVQEIVPASSRLDVELERIQENDNMPKDKNLKMALNDDAPLSLSGLMAYPDNTDIALPSPSKSIKSILYGHCYEANENDIGNNSPTTEQLLWPQSMKHIPLIEELSPTGEQDPAEGNTDTVDEILQAASANLEFYDEPIKLNFYVDIQQQDANISGPIGPDRSLAKNTRNPFTVNRDTYQCPICHKEIQHESYFKKHLSKHEITSKLYCKICCIYFTDRFEKRQHSKEVHRKVRKLLFQCDHCDKMFYDSSNYKRHLLVHENKEGVSFICDLCGRSVATKAKLLLHLRTHQIFKNLPQDSFARNREVVHKERECLICGIMVKGQNYYPHIRTHNESLQSHQCELCKKRFYRRNELNNHMGTVHGSKTLLHACFKCEMAFVSTTTLNRHIQRVHIAENCFECNECNGEFPSKHELRSHLFSVHDFKRRKEDAAKRFKCAHCDQKFHSIRAVNVHTMKSKKCLKLRDKEFNEFTCLYCKAKFMRQGDLNTHIQNTKKCLAARNILTSEPARKFTCAKCEKVFLTVKGLNNHVRFKKKCSELHTDNFDGKVFTCPYCKATFIRKSDLTFHIKNTAKCLVLRNIGITSEVQCRLCHRFAGASVRLKRHMSTCSKATQVKSMTDTGYYKCIFCGKTFHMFKVLARHMKTSSACIASRGNNDETQSQEQKI